MKKRENEMSKVYWHFKRQTVASSSRCSKANKGARLRLNEKNKKVRTAKKLSGISLRLRKSRMDGWQCTNSLSWKVARAESKSIFSTYTRLSNIKCDSFIYFSARFIEFYNVEWRFDNTSIVECYIDLPIEVPLKRTEMQEKSDLLTKGFLSR